MIEIEMNKDVQTFEPKIMGPFTRRQLISLVIAAAYAGPIAIAVPGDPMMKVLLGCILAIPAILCGFIDILGMPLLQFITYCVIPSLINPKVRKFKSETSYEMYWQQLKAVSSKSKKEKDKPTSKKVTYSKKYRHRSC